MPKFSLLPMATAALLALALSSCVSDTSQSETPVPEESVAVEPSPTETEPATHGWTDVVVFGGLYVSEPESDGFAWNGVFTETRWRCGRNSDIDRFLATPGDLSTLDAEALWSDFISKQPAGFETTGKYCVNAGEGHASVIDDEGYYVAGADKATYQIVPEGDGLAIYDTAGELRSYLVLVYEP